MEKPNQESHVKGSNKAKGNNLLDLDPEVRLYFRDQFRDAIATAQRDAEGFQEILFTIERLGITLTGKVLDLGKYQKDFQEFVTRDSSREAVAQNLRQWHLPFSELYEIVKDARNDALHQGAAARHITTNAIRLAIVLQDALMSPFRFVREFMVRDPVCAYLWQPISIVRQQMLLNNYTYLPLWDDRVKPGDWKLVSDYEVAKYLHKAQSKNHRKELLAKALEYAVIEDELHLDEAEICKPDSYIQELILSEKLFPLVVINDNNPSVLLGILTPFDLL